MYLVCSCFKNILIKLIWIDLWVLFQTNKYSQEDLIKILRREVPLNISVTLLLSVYRRQLIIIISPQNKSTHVLTPSHGGKMQIVKLIYR
jgi:hypothetical protein